MIFYFVNKLKKIFPFILFLIFFFSINAEPWKINIFLDKNSFNDYINYFRGILPIISGFFIFCYVIINKKKFEIVDIVAIIFFLYFLLQLFGLLINFPINEEDNFYYRIYFLLLLFFSIFLFLSLKKNYLNKFLILMTILILVVNLYFLTIATFEFFFINKKPFYYLKIFQAENTILGSPSIRSTGLARINLILFIFTLVYLEQIKKNYIIFFIILNLLCIILLQSRVNIYSLYFFLIFYLFFFKNIKIQERIKFFIIFSCIPLLIYHSIKFDQSSIIEEKSIRTNLNSNIIFNRSKHESVDNFTTGRFTIWKDLLSSKKNFKQITFGFGTQADRVLTAPAYFSASNSYVYIFISSGIIGLIIILSFIIFLIYRITKLIFVNKIFSKNGNILLKFSILLFTYLLIRSLVESSFAVYGIDYLFFILSSKIIILSTTR
jgi:hypothetical protein